MNIVVTGASGGIGKAIADALELDGATVIRHSRKACDVADDSGVRAWVGGLGRQVDHVDALVHCAGIAGEVSEVVNSDAAKWIDTIRVNLGGAYLMSRAMIPLMKARGGHILLMSGGGAFNAFPNMSAYAASKSAIVRLAETMAVELEPWAIRVNCLAPGFQKTRLIEHIIEAGPLKGGKAFIETQVNMDRGGDIERLKACARFMLGKEFEGVTGRTVSALHDKWDEKGFAKVVKAGRSYQLGRMVP